MSRSNEISRVKYCPAPNKVSRIKFWDDDKPVYKFRIAGDFDIVELRDILHWAEQEMKL